jgi:SAM-dependent MidA family methyltransferase
MGRPDPVVLAEAGPGRGTLMADALRLIRRVAPGFGTALRLHLVETSPRLRAIQASRLPDATWHDRVEDVPVAPMILLGNEFLDALPIRQFVQHGGVRTERYVDQAQFVEQPAPDHHSPNPVVFEERDPALARHLGDRYRRTPGVALFLDYGPMASGPGDSLQALRDGKPADPLAQPGSADLTAHVDFAAFARDSGLAAHGPIPQGKFLTRLGLFTRIDRLAQTLPPRAGLRMTEAGRRLAEPDRMGALFKALALTTPGLPIPAGFEA